MAEVAQKNMGKYCKAYPISRFRDYAGWSEKAENVRKDTVVEDGNECEVIRELTDEDHLYLQENFVVTDGIFIDENVIFENVTPEWIDYCKTSLGFEIPDYALDEEESAVETAEES